MGKLLGLFEGQCQDTYLEMVQRPANFQRLPMAKTAFGFPSAMDRLLVFVAVKRRP